MTTASSLQTIRPRELRKLCDAGTVELIDVRTPVEFREVHSTFARNVPLDSLDPKAVMEQRKLPNDQPLYVICRSGSRSTKACEAFLKAGYSNIINVEGGTQAWDDAGLPVVRGRKAVSLERQVRIAAGFIVLSGSLATWFTQDLRWLGVPGFVGAGLMFAGITDTCAMGMLIAKMPWNQVKPDASSCDASKPSASCCS